MSIRELGRKRLTEVKRRYLVELADEGSLGEVVFGDETISELSCGDMMEADVLVPDDVIFNVYDGVEFVEDDFWD